MRTNTSPNVVVIIPCYNPDKKLIAFLQELVAAGFTDIILINDGSKDETLGIFEDAVDNYGCRLLSHSVNLGQGRAYKTAFNYYLAESRKEGKYTDTIGIIQCDCDGQHCIEDVKRCAELLKKNPDKFILGVRDFTEKNIPFRSRFGNNATNLVFRLCCGINIKDTQTGLKGIPKSIIPSLIETPGERFEYASSVLLEIKRQGVNIIQFNIRTIYINDNETSHFNPIVDSIRIYSLILKYLFSSLSGFLFDMLFYIVLINMLDSLYPNYYIVISTFISRIILSIYVFIVNKKIVFRNDGKILPSAMKFFLLCVLQATLSGFSVRALVYWFGHGRILFKLIVDTLLFFVSFRIQDSWVFKNGFTVQTDK